jgi:hypothetical protein
VVSERFAALCGAKAYSTFRARGNSMYLRRIFCFIDNASRQCPPGAAADAAAQIGSRGIALREKKLLPCEPHPTRRASRHSPDGGQHRGAISFDPWHRESVLLARSHGNRRRQAHEVCPKRRRLGGPSRERRRTRFGIAMQFLEFEGKRHRKCAHDDMHHIGPSRLQ